MSACLISGWSFSAPVLMTLLVGLGVALLARWLRHQQQFAGSSAFSLMHLAILWWLGVAALEMSVHQQSCKMFWAGMAWPAILGVPTFWSVFLWQYVNSVRSPLKPLAVTGLMVMPALFWLLALSNPWHFLFYGSASAPISSEPNAPIVYQHGPLFYLAAAYGYPFMIFCIGITLRAVALSSGLHRRHYLVFLILTTIPWAANISYVAFGWTLFGFDPTPFSFALTVAGFGWLISGLRLFDLLPVARHLLLDALMDPVLVIDPQRRVIEANPSALGMANLKKGWHGCALAQWPHIGSTLDGMVQQAELGDTPQLISVETRQQHFEVRVRAICRSTREGTVTLGQMLYLRDITEFQRSQQQLAEALALSEQQLATISSLHKTLQDQALRDPLTDLYNRRYLEEFFAREAARAQRDDAPIALAMVDLDHFKRLNDTHGHAVGDDALKAVAAFLLDGLRTTDAVFRIGGEEFLLILPSTQPAEALGKLAHLCERFADQPLETRAGLLHLTMSIGVVHFPSQASDLDGLMQQADRQLYLAKDCGRNRVMAMPGTVQATVSALPLPR
ncbi:diguanylate cyclase [Pseudomonas xanthomarina]|uniref:diguanylate cyclase n=3 Tax=Stutzerimonas xanthomarina TaxID=271420 RepID=A0A1M5MM33_9GAMM|nr:histidine kinase N-terminal 7TM domain-containing protein [Stutzerimonas xanthomarina]MCP9337567.1 diguanylate cyclase [Stutzerimonas xanthomarina]SEH88274.1 diguanylate cyclase (GGDEF) domain-containing protein [Stutzerimonas xanthomarina]SHG78368.1 diguanylate cyclase (GGDEF) domain-containing protein [Stutzerimonas xanthomarina DSM 18231]